MTYRCFSNKHRPSSSISSNQGFSFSQCERCGQQLVRSRVRWIAVPRQFRVVWRETVKPDVTPRPLAPLTRGGGRGHGHPHGLAHRHGTARPIEGAWLFIRLGATMLMWVTADRLRNSRLSGPKPLLRLPAPSGTAKAA